MRHALWMIALLATSLVVAGCAKSDPPNQAADGSGTSAGNRSPSSDQAAAPTEIVSRFYDALREGDASKIAALLTDKAREETSKSGLAIRSPGSSSLTYEIGESEFVTPEKDGAHVKSVWTETDADGQLASTDVIWVLRKQQNGWRIAGMATPVKEGELPLLFNFEDPENMLRNKELVESQHAEDQQATVRQAAKPSDDAASSTLVR